MDVRGTLKQRAVELGFDLVGIAPAVPGRDLDFVQDWLDRGYAGEMAYLSNPKRLDPKLVLPSLQSVICVGLIYDTPFPHSTEVGRWQKAEGSMQEAEGRKQDSGVRSQASGVRIEGLECGGLNSAGSEPQFVENQPSPAGRGCPDSIGAGEGVESRFSNFDSRVSNFQFPVSSDAGGQDARAPRAWISRYAWGRDYHVIMRVKLEKLRSAVEELAPGVETRVYVDTGPVSERAFARLSGLGWMGKNTCIINEEKGSWFFLGVILTSLSLAPDLPAPDRCGSCTACLDACPTGALVEPYVMDASRCISYLTIELKGSIPQNLRKGIGSHIFGCDICQDVCPWNGKNRSQKPEVRSKEAAFWPMVLRAAGPDNESSTKDEGRITNDERQEIGLQAGSSQHSIGIRVSSIQNPKSEIQNPHGPRHPGPDTFSLYAPPLEALASISEDDFRQAFRHSPIKRAKYRGWLRNLCVAMGNSRNLRFVPKLKALAASPDPVVREHAEWALAQLGSAPR